MFQFKGALDLLAEIAIETCLVILFVLRESLANFVASNGSTLVLMWHPHRTCSDVVRFSIFRVLLLRSSKAAYSLHLLGARTGMFWNVIWIWCT